MAMVMNSNTKARLPLYVGIGAFLLFIFALLHQHKDNLPESARNFVAFRSKHDYDSYDDEDVTDIGLSSDDEDEEVLAKPKPFKSPKFAKGSKSGKPPKSAKVSKFPKSSKSSSKSSSKTTKISKGKDKSGFSTDDTSAASEPNFLAVAQKTGTDKVTTHSYQDMYETYLPPLRHKRIKMLEIGLGCDMNYGPGKSYALWLEYFTDVDLYFMEYDAECAKKWAAKTDGATIVPGDQEDAAFLERFIEEHGGDFDIIIDDGGHTMAQQQVSLQHLWKAVKPGGMYFCEDLQTSWWDKYGGGGTAKAQGVLTTVQYIHRLIEDLSMGPRQVIFDDVESMVHIDCSREVCMFRKKGQMEIEA